MRKIYIYLLVFFLVSFCQLNKVAAQGNLRPGFIVTTGDTLAGFLSSNTNRNSKVCLFTLRQDAPLKEYYPKDILFYGFTDGKVFASKTLDITPNDLRSVFVERLVKGAINLYLYEGILYVEKQKSLQALKVERQEVYVNGNKYSKTLTPYINTLKNLTQDCAQLSINIERVQLSQRSITNLIETYNNCISPQDNITYNNQTPWIKLKAGLLTGISFANLSFTQSNPGSKHTYADADFGYSPGFLAGAFLNIAPERISEHISLQLEAIYNKAKHNTYIERPLPPTNTPQTRNTIDIDLSFFKVATLARYTFSRKFFSPYLTLGLSTNTLIDGQVDFKREIEFTDRVETRQSNKSFESADFIFTKNNLGPVGAVGATYAINTKNKLNLEIRYERTNDIHSNGKLMMSSERLADVFYPLNSFRNNLSLLVGFSF